MPPTRLARLIATFLDRQADAGREPDTVRALARAVGVDEKAVRRWLEGSYPRLDHARELAAVMGVSLDHLARS